MTDLQRLIEAVEAGVSTRLSIEEMGINILPKMVDGVNAGTAYHGSLDAAKALHEALTPYPDVDIEYRLFGGLCDVTIYDVPGGSVTATSTNPARAWLLAILRALAAEGGE